MSIEEINVKNVYNKIAKPFICPVAKENIKIELNGITINIIISKP